MLEPHKYLELNEHIHPQSEQEVVSTPIGQIRGYTNWRNMMEQEEISEVARSIKKSNHQ